MARGRRSSIEEDEAQRRRLASKRGDLNADGKVDSKEMQYIADFAGLDVDDELEMQEVDENKVMEDTGKDEDDEHGDESEELLFHQKYIEKDKVIRKLIRYRLSRRHYISLLMFATFMGSFFTTLTFQRRQDDIADLGRTMRVEIASVTKATVDMKGIDFFWSWLDGSFLPRVFSNRWETHVRAEGDDEGEGGTSGSNMTASGYRLDDYNNLVGGVWIRAIRRQERPCTTQSLYDPWPEHQVCYHYGTGLHHEEIEETFEDTPHKIFFPSVLGLEDLKEISDTHKKLDTIAVGTHGILIAFMVYNPTCEAIATIEVELQQDITGHWKTHLSSNSIPYSMYPNSRRGLHFWLQIAFEVVFLTLWSMLAISFMRGIMRSWHILPAWLSPMSTGSFFNFSILAAPEYEHYPGDWRAFWMNAMMMHCSIVADLVVWGILTFQYEELHASAAMSKHATALLLPSDRTGKRLVEFAVGHEEAYRNVFRVTTGVSSMSHTYFMLCGVTCVLMTLRFFEYLHFQKKLSVITETFMHSMGEIGHLFLVLSVSVFGFAFAMFLMLGGQVRAFRSFTTSVFNVWQMLFGMWKPKPNQLKYDVQIIAELLVMLFRLVVVLLLLKMLFAMIFEGYKSVANKKSKKGNSVAKDISELSWHMWNRFSYLCNGSCYVDPVKIEVLLRDESIKNTAMLNSMQLVTQMRKVFKKGKYGVAHAEWIINKYGTTRSDIGHYGSMGEPPSEEVKEMLKETFKEFDTDNSKTISQNELSRALQRMGMPEMRHGTLEALLERLGNDPKDPDAELNMDQFCALLTGHYMDGRPFWGTDLPLPGKVKAESEQVETARSPRSTWIRSLSARRPDAAALRQVIPLSVNPFASSDVTLEMSSP